MISEMLSSIKLIKLLIFKIYNKFISNAWEWLILNKIKEVRKAEIKIIERNLTN